MSGRDVYISIMKAAALGLGVRLTASEVFALSLDDAIATRASNGLPKDQWEQLASITTVFDWRDANDRNHAPFNGYARAMYGVALDVPEEDVARSATLFP